MTRLIHVVKGLGAMALLVVLVAGIPWALWHFVGWPLPHHVPSASQVGRALNHQTISNQALIDAMAVVVWITWAVLVISIAVEVPAALSGRHASRLPLTSIFQPITGRLVTAVIVAALALAPRPGHTGIPEPASGATAVMGRRPIAALIVRGTDLTSTVSLVSTTAATTAAEPAATAPQPVAPLTTYVVQRGDTLWGIAQRELGDPLLWSAIYQLNEGRPQPGGMTLIDPHWIDPGWTLVLPAAPTTSSPPPAATPAPAQSAPTPMPATPTPSAPMTTIPSTAGSASSMPTARGHSPASSNGAGGHHIKTTEEPVHLPSGSVVAASFAAGVAATIAIGRLRRRHTYRYRPPEPGRTRAAEPPRPTLFRLRQAATGDDEQPDGADLVPAMSVEPSAMPVNEEERRRDPGRLDVGSRGGDVVTMELSDLSGVAIDGPGVDDVARALVAALFVRAEPGAAEALLTDEVGERLLPGLAPDRAIRRAATTDHVARSVESERVARARRFEAAGVTDAGQFRAENPENPLPLLLVLLDAPPAGSLGRWAALAADAPRLAIAVVFLSPVPIATGQLTIDTDRWVLHAAPADRLGTLVGAQLFAMHGDEATEVLTAVSDAAREGDLDEDHLLTNGAVNGLQADDPSIDFVIEPWPDPFPPQSDGGADQSDERPIVVRLFGHFEVAVHGEPVAAGLRSRARDVFAWCLLRPEGATSDEVVDALWPDTPPDRVHGQFWRSFSDLRSRLREAGGVDLDVLTKVGEHYRPCAREMTCDLWEFQAALRQAARAEDPEVARAALRRGVEVCRGELLAGIDRPWIEPVRQDLHRRALDAHLRLAELEEQAGRADAAVEMLERAIERDRYAEEPYRRLMALYAAHGRPGAVTDIWRLLQDRLAELDLDVEAATTALYQRLASGRPDPERVGQPARP